MRDGTCPSSPSTAMRIVEQFVITPTTAALEDFDQSGYGPAVVDLVRYAASIHLTICRAGHLVVRRGPRRVRLFFAPIGASLDQPPERAPLAVAARIRLDDAGSRRSVDRMGRRPPPLRSRPSTSSACAGMADFQRLEAEVHPARSAAYYDIVRVGSLQMGVGSALETKLLFRLRGPTDAPGDDLIVEARTSDPPSINQCASRPLHGGALEPLMFMTLLGPRMPEVFGFAALGTDTAPEFGCSRGSQATASCPSRICAPRPSSSSSPRTPHASSRATFGRAFPRLSGPSKGGHS